MKIQKGHYVPKELITSEALHEAVVKCFVAAGFSDERPHFGKVGNISEGDDGLGIWNGNGQPTIIWGIKGDSVDEPLTLQQLFTAENGLQWPDGADSVISYGGDCVAFVGDDVWRIISGKVLGFETKMPLVLATRQPKEKEVESEALDKADNSWHERGELPPVGVQVAVTLDKHDRSAEVCGSFCDYVWVRYEDEAMPDTVHKMYIRPIRTEREKFIEEATAAAIIGDDKSVKLNPCITVAFERLFDAGFRGPKVEK